MANSAASSAALESKDTQYQLILLYQAYGDDAISLYVPNFEATITELLRLVQEKVQSGFLPLDPTKTTAVLPVLKGGTIEFEKLPMDTTVTQLRSSFAQLISQKLKPGDIIRVCLCPSAPTHLENWYQIREQMLKTSVSDAATAESALRDYFREHLPNAFRCIHSYQCLQQSGAVHAEKDICIVRDLLSFKFPSLKTDVIPSHLDKQHFQHEVVLDGSYLVRIEVKTSLAKIDSAHEQIASPSTTGASSVISFTGSNGPVAILNGLVCYDTCPKMLKKLVLGKFYSKFSFIAIVGFATFFLQRFHVSSVDGLFCRSEDIWCPVPPNGAFLRKIDERLAFLSANVPRPILAEYLTGTVAGATASARSAANSSQ